MITHQNVNATASVADPVLLDREGYIQEANRRFFHPLGLHLLMAIMHSDEDWNLYLLDGRKESPAGIIYGPATTPGCAEGREARSARIEEEWKRRVRVRRVRAGYIRQPEEDLSRLSSEYWR